MRATNGRPYGMLKGSLLREPFGLQKTAFPPCTPLTGVL